MPTLSLCGRQIRDIPAMPSSGAPAVPRLPIDDTYFELLADTLEGMDISARSQFLQRYFRTLTRLELSESQSLQLWEEILKRRREFSEQLGHHVSLKTVLMDVLVTGEMIRVPMVLEYEEFKKLQVSAVTDPLTGLYNRRLFSESFDKEMNRAKRYGLPLGIVMLDLHRFKEVNDRYGHPRGDDILCAAASTLQRSLRTSDFAFRIGGDEFALLLPQTDTAQALALCRRIESIFEETLKAQQLAFPVTMDHGIATFPHDGDQPEQLIRLADERLYQLKHANHQSRSAEPSSRRSQPAPPQEIPSQGPIPIDAGRPAEKNTSSEFEQATSEAALSLTSQTEPKHISYAIQRKAERVSMAGTNAYAVIGDSGSHRARVLDLGFGGVALEFDEAHELSENIVATLHVPILPPVRVSLRPVWSRRTVEGGLRLGCHFVS
jgi:diguanylate cyclase (GGDEF)-like protein